MAEVNCPMCGKPNPDDLDVCQYCNARLKPLTAPLDPIRAGDAPTPKDTGDLEGTLPSWLREARSAEEKAAAEEIPQEPVKPPKVDSSDLLGGLASAKEEDEVVPDWLSSLNPDTVKTPSVKAADQHERPEAENLQGGGTEQTGAQPAAAPAEPFDSGMTTGPDDLSRTGVESSKPFDDDDFRGFTAGDFRELPSQDNDSQPFTTFERDPNLAEGELPDWLSSGNVEDSSQEAAAPGESQSDAELPDWLAGADSGGGATISAEESPGQEFPEIAGEPLMPEEPASGESEPLPAAEDGSEFPAWLSNLESEEGQELPSAVPAFGSEQTGGTPVEAPPETGPSEEAPAPDWLADFSNEEPSAEPSRVHAFTDVPEEPEESKPPDSGLPDWLGELPAVESESSQSEQEAAGEPVAAEPPSGTPIAGEPSFADEQPASNEDVEAIFSMDMPDWLSSLGPGEQETELTTGESTAEGDESLAPGELPSWVQAMRPVEAVVDEAPSVAEDVDRKVEHKGPLAGLSGTLPAGPGISPTRKPQVHAIKLQVSDVQQVNAALLERLLTSEVQPRPLTKTSQMLTQRVLRWAITIVLVLVVGVTTFAGTHIVPTPDLHPNETLAAVNAVNGLSADSTVLLVFDYNPGLSGELEAAATPVVDHLMLKGVKLATLSTLPTGPALAERFMKSLQVDHAYQAGQEYVDLGFLPGGPAGILGFASEPLATIRSSVDGVSPWSSPPLENIKAFKDFSAVVLLTDEPDTARIWIEQAGPKLGGNPLLLVVSAQAEPMVRPYYESDQVQGMVTGLMGGISYEKVNSRPGLSTRYWDAFSFGIFIAELMIVVGSAWNLISNWLARRRQTVEES